MSAARILVVDDSDDDVALRRRAKAGLGPSLQIIDNGEAALAYLAGHGRYFEDLLALVQALPRFWLGWNTLPRPSGI